MKQITYQAAREITLKRAAARGIDDLEYQVRDVVYEQKISGIQVTFRHYYTGKYRRTFIQGCYLPDHRDPSLPAV